MKHSRQLVKEAGTDADPTTIGTFKKGGVFWFRFETALPKGSRVPSEVKERNTTGRSFFSGSSCCFSAKAVPEGPSKPYVWISGFAIDKSP